MSMSWNDDPRPAATRRRQPGEDLHAFHRRAKQPCSGCPGVASQPRPRLRPTRAAWLLLWLVTMVGLALVLSGLADALVPVPHYPAP